MKQFILIRARAVRIRTNRVTWVHPRAKKRIRIRINPTTKDMRMCMTMEIMTMTGIIGIPIMQMEWTMQWMRTKKESGKLNYLQKIGSYGKIKLYIGRKG